MANYQKGYLGSFNGKLGTAIGSHWRDITYLRSLPRKSSKLSTQAQADQRAKFGLVGHFITKINPLLKLVNQGTGKTTGANEVFSNTIKTAVIGTYPAYDIDYTKVVICTGVLLNANSPAVVAAGSGIVKFNWQDNTDGAMAKADDQCILLAYCPEAGHSMYKLPGSPRNASADTLNMVNYTGKTVHTWIAFQSADGKKLSSSIYAGSVVIA